MEEVQNSIVGLYHKEDNDTLHLVFGNGFMAQIEDPRELIISRPLTDPRGPFICISKENFDKEYKKLDEDEVQEALLKLYGTMGSCSDCDSGTCSCCES